MGLFSWCVREGIYALRQRPDKKMTQPFLHSESVTLGHETNFLVLIRAKHALCFDGVEYFPLEMDTGDFAMQHGAVALGMNSRTRSWVHFLAPLHTSCNAGQLYNCPLP